MDDERAVVADEGHQQAAARPRRPAVQLSLRVGERKSGTRVPREPSSSEQQPWPQDAITALIPTRPSFDNHAV
ncbi:hypothetical protein I552_2222 [Mycobacterium xenopi 3993]|nr:hypothetical protein I552_2222 [Mycobacterium xenopi 3993]